MLEIEHIKSGCKPRNHYWCKLLNTTPKILNNPKISFLPVTDVLGSEIADWLAKTASIGDDKNYYFPFQYESDLPRVINSPKPSIEIDNYLALSPRDYTLDSNEFLQPVEKTLQLALNRKQKGN